MGNLSVLQKSEARKTQPQSKTFLDVLRKHLAIFGEHYRQPITELSVMAYGEDLAKLTPEQLEAACIEARRSSEFMPVSAAILKAHEELQKRNTNRSEFLGPRLEWSAGEHTDYLKRWMRDQQAPRLPEPAAIPEKPKRIAHVTKPIEEQKEELRRRGFLQ